MTQAVLLGGLFIGVLSALPIVRAGNCCCLWILSGGVLTAYLAQEVDPHVGLMTGARLGFRAGLFGALVWLAAAGAAEMIMSPLEQSASDLILRSATDVPPAVRAWLEAYANSASVTARLVGGLIFQLVIGAPFAALGGLLGAAMFGQAQQRQHQ